MLFTYCKKTQENFSTVPYLYHVSPLQTVAGFGKKPAVCANINVPYVSNRGLPRSLIDLETDLKGQGRTLQPFCGDPNAEKPLQFSRFDWMQKAPVPSGPMPCAPVPFIQVNQYGETLCNHVGLKTRCGESCSCSSNCQCKELWRGRNMIRPQATMLPLHTVPGCKITK